MCPAAQLCHKWYGLDDTKYSSKYTAWMTELILYEACILH